jgi:hypothetical protein
MSDPLALRIGPCSVEAGTVALLRSATHLPMSVITEALKTATPLAICDLFGLDHDEKEKLVLSLFSALSGRGTNSRSFFVVELRRRRYFAICSRCTTTSPTTLAWRRNLNWGSQARKRCGGRLASLSV